MKDYTIGILTIPDEIQIVLDVVKVFINHYLKVLLAEIEFKLEKEKICLYLDEDKCTIFKYSAIIICIKKNRKKFLM